MQLFYFKDVLGNFGDDLNPWVWSRLIPNAIDEDQDTIFIGIGTLINHRIPITPFKHVFGSGVGYGHLPKIDNKFEFHAVRGYESAKALGLSPDKVVTDSAIFVRALFDQSIYEKKWRFGFMPTGETEKNFDWRPVCNDLNVNYISCHLPVAQALKEISLCNVMICEAMHGAIVSDSLGIPWIPVRCNENISEFKWRDWLSSLAMIYRPNDIPQIFQGVNGVENSVKNSVKRIFKKSGVWKDNWSKPLPIKSSEGEVALSVAKFEEILGVEPQLSSNSTKDLLLDKYFSLVDKFNQRFG